MENKASKIVLTVVLAGILIFGASFTRAQSTDEYIKALQTQIQTLLRYIQQLQLQLTQKTTTTTATIPTSTSTSTNKFFIMEDDGSLLSENNNIIQVNTTAAAQRFYKSFNDDYDFLSFYTAFSTNQQPATKYHATISNNVEGINSAIKDYSQDYGSKGRLKGTNFMQSIDEYELQFPMFTTLLHETGHQWLAYIGNHADGNKLNVTKDGIHWSEETNTDWDPMGGVRYKDNGDGTFTMLSHSSGEPWQYYCPQSLYLMGLLPPNEVPDLMVVTVQDPACLNDLDYLNGRKPCPGTARYVSTKDIIAVEGERLPSSADSQKDFRMAFVLITKKGQKSTDEQIQKMNYIVENFSNAWAKATRNLSTMSTNLLSAPSLICTDSDGGNNPYVKGTVTLDSQTYTDSCSTINTLKEYYCANNQIQNYMVICSSGYICQDGACKFSTPPTTIVPTCTDSDGYNIYVKGTVTSNGQTYTDSCLSNNTVAEYSCDNGKLKSTSAGCPNGYSCANGACVAPSGSCTDSDGGQNIYVKGVVTLGSQTYTDSCIDSNTVYEYYCPNPTIYPNDPNFFEAYSTTCPSGYTCQDGACIPSSSILMDALNKLSASLISLMELLKR